VVGDGWRVGAGIWVGDVAALNKALKLSSMSVYCSAREE